MPCDVLVPPQPPVNGFGLWRCSELSNDLSDTVSCAVHVYGMNVLIADDEKLFAVSALPIRLLCVFIRYTHLYANYDESTAHFVLIVSAA